MKAKVTADTPPVPKKKKKKSRNILIISPEGCKIFFHLANKSDSGLDKNWTNKQVIFIVSG